MAFTEQQVALKKLKEKFGQTAFAEDHGTYKRVGFKREGKKVYAIGSTWDEAEENLEGMKDQ